MKIGIYGGTFDPPHRGHMEAALGAVEALGLDKLILIPASIPPHKVQAVGGATGKERFTMTALMADGINLKLRRPGLAEASDIELNRPGASYTVDTLVALKNAYPDDELCLLMGADMADSFDGWRFPAEILKMVKVTCFPREANDAHLVETAQHLMDTLGGEITVLNNLAVHPISSTQLRRGLREGRGHDHLWCQVNGYVLRYNLYGTTADLKNLTVEQLSDVSLSMVKAKRIPHILGCAQEAVKLAKRWGADPVKAYRGGILHDCTKYLSLKEHLAICARYNLPLDDMERGAEKLLHAKTGALLAMHIFGETKDIVNAIYYHTTGICNMSLLSKILYVADYMEPSRADFDGLADLRRLAYEDLDGALLLGCELTISEMEERGVPVHADTIAARDFLKGC